MDCFYEQFIGKDYGAKQKKFEATKEVLIVVAVIVSMFQGVIFGLAVFVIYIILGIFGKNMFLEYEYELTENELVISKIMNKKGRKVIGTIDINNVVDVISADSKLRDGVKIVNASFDDGELGQQILYVNKDSKLIGFKVSMDRNLIYKCKRINVTSFRNI